MERHRAEVLNEGFALGNVYYWDASIQPRSWEVSIMGK